MRKVLLSFSGRFIFREYFMIIFSAKILLERSLENESYIKYIDRPKQMIAEVDSLSTQVGTR